MPILILRVFALAVPVLTLGEACISGVVAQSQPAEAGQTTARFGIGPGWSLLGTPPADGSNSVIATEEERRFLGISGFVGFTREVGGQFSLGLEASGWTGTTDVPSWTEKRRTQLGLHGVGYFYPTVQTRFFVKGGLGLGVVAIDTVDGGSEDSGLGVGLLMGVGYDIPVGSKTVLSVYLDVPFVRRFRDGVPNVIQMGLALGR